MDREHQTYRKKLFQVFGINFKRQTQAHVIRTDFLES